MVNSAICISDKNLNTGFKLFISATMIRVFLDIQIAMKV